MTILEVATRKSREIIIENVDSKDLKKITVKRYFFNWKKEATIASLYKLRLKNDEDIKGIIALTDFPDERRIEIKLLATAKENVILSTDPLTKKKEFEGIAANLIAFAAREAILKYGADACISLIPKTSLKSYYIKEYQMEDGGWHLFLEGRKLYALVKNYIL